MQTENNISVKLNRYMLLKFNLIWKKKKSDSTDTMLPSLLMGKYQGEFFLSGPSKLNG